VILRQNSTSRGTRSRAAYSLSALLGCAGVLHFLLPRPYDRMIPKWIPGSPRSWTYGSGVAELAVAAAVAVPRSRRRGALTAATLFIVVFPGNVQMALEARRRDSAIMRVGTLVRLPLQIPLIAWAWYVARRA
jgi:uncharacterized membrane protein